MKLNGVSAKVLRSLVKKKEFQGELKTDLLISRHVLVVEEKVGGKLPDRARKSGGGGNQPTIKVS